MHEITIRPRNFTPRHMPKKIENIFTNKQKKILCKNLHSSIICSSRKSPGICQQVTHCEIPLSLDVKDVSTEGHALYDSPHNRCPECANPEKRKLAGDCQGLVEGRSQVLTLNGFKVSLACGEKVPELHTSG